MNQVERIEPEVIVWPAQGRGRRHPDMSPKRTTKLRFLTLTFFSGTRTILDVTSVFGAEETHFARPMGRKTYSIIFRRTLAKKIRTPGGPPPRYIILSVFHVRNKLVGLKILYYLVFGIGRPEFKGLCHIWSISNLTPVIFLPQSTE